MRANPLRQQIAEGRPIVNAWVSGAGTYAAEVLSHSGFDAVTIDHQHGMFGLGGAIGLLQAVSAGPATPMARCSALNPAEIGKLLDAGAYGIICPSIDTSEQCAELVSTCRYPPTGRRSFGPARGLLYGGPDYTDHADTTVQVWAMIESAAAMDALEAIVDVPGLDGVYVGPNDLALSLGGRPGQEPVDPAVEDALARILQTAHAAGTAVGLFCASGEAAARRAAQGFDLVTPGNDIATLRQAAADRVAAVRGIGPRQDSHAGY